MAQSIPIDVCQEATMDVVFPSLASAHLEPSKHHGLFTPIDVCLEAAFSVIVLAGWFQGRASRSFRVPYFGAHFTTISEIVLAGWSQRRASVRRILF